MSLKFYRDNSFSETCIAPRPDMRPMFDSDDKFYLGRNYSLCFILSGDKIEIFIPIFFIFDGASIPRFFWRIVGHPYKPRFIVAALPHDALFGKISGRVKIWLNGQQLTSKQAEEYFTREVTDDIFRGILEEEKNAGWKVRVMHRSVRLGGWLRFRKSENEFYKGEYR